MTPWVDIVGSLMLMATGALMRHWLGFSQAPAAAAGARRAVPGAAQPGGWERRPFEALRASAPPPRDHIDDGSNQFIAVLEIDRFRTLRQLVGLTLAGEIVNGFVARIRDHLPAVVIGRVGRTTVEFAFPAPSVAEAEEALHALCRSLERHIDVAGFGFDLAVAIGAARVAAGVLDDEALDRAAAALSVAQKGRAKVVVDDLAIAAQPVFDSLRLIRELPVAMANGELSLFYQPKLRTRTNSIDAVEALLRWHHPEFGLVQTDLLIELAEETGAIKALTEWVTARAIADHARLRALGHELELFINVSGKVLPEPGFAEQLLARIHEAGATIGLEITETAVIEDPTGAMANLNAFHAAGIKVAIDDYGSGLSSLAYLKQLPAQELKIDQLFIKALTHSNRDPLLVRSSIDLAHALEMEVTAEGVDDPMSFSLLRVMGIDLVQGFLISPPLDVEGLVAFLDAFAHAPPQLGSTLSDWPAALPLAPPAAHPA